MNPELQDEIKRRLATLPAVVQDAIANIDVQNQMRAVSDNHDLHIDQWAALEKEVMLTLLGMQDSQDLPKHIESAIGVSAEEAEALAKDIGAIVFEPIREELERQLEHPEAKEKAVAPEEAARQSILASNSGVVPATPPAPKPSEKAVRAPLSSTYTARQPSSNRSSVTGDPYREPPI